MSFIADTHVHLYPLYNIDRTLCGAAARLDSLAAKEFAAGTSATRVLCLTERNSENFFERFLKGEQTELSNVRSEEPFSLSGKTSSGQQLTLIAGRQIATRERLELTVLGCRAKAPEGLTLDEALSWTLSVGGLPVFNWSLGKWLGAREKLVSDFVERLSPGAALIGDVFMRPLLIPEPIPMQKAKSRGLRVIAGTDPLPVGGEENLIGKFAICGAADLGQTPWKSLAALLRNSSSDVRICGTRGGIFSAAMRSVRYRLKR